MQVSSCQLTCRAFESAVQGKLQDSGFYGLRCGSSRVTHGYSPGMLAQRHFGAWFGEGGERPARRD